MGESVSRPRWWSTLLWGNTVALSWMWGLGLFFTVQFTSQFGLFGLLTFSIPNFLGLMAFGWVTQRIAQRSGSSESLANFFTRWSRPFQLVFLLYQILAIALTIFAIIHYLWQPLGLEPRGLFLPLTLLIVLAAAILFGEEFNIQRIKFSHGTLMLLALAAIGVLLFGRADLADVSGLRPDKLPTNDLNYWGYAVPICIGFLVGPWLDLQQWQRAIQMQRERISIRWAYVAGSLQFFALLLFHGALTLWARESGAAGHFREGLAGYTYAHDMLVRFFDEQASAQPWVFAAYCVFLCVCILTTLDSGYIAFRWFLQSHAKTSQHPIFSLVPGWLVTSPIPLMVCCGLVALAGAVGGLELEYFMIFYATFFVGYSTLGIARCFVISSANLIPQVKMFSVGSLAVVIFAYGYFLRYPVLQIAGSLLPLGYVAWLLLKPGAAEEFVADADELAAVAESSLASHRPLPPTPTDVGMALTPATPLTASVAAGVPSAQAVHDLSGHFEGKWFVHQFISTYADTNSVGNVYFGMYAMWVGKTRELFFNKVMPKFDLQTTPFYILTRSFEHKFMRETREFEPVSVRIRIGSYNRKFVTLEHEVYDSRQQMLGKGKQSLLFVSSADYHMIDIPPEVYSAFVTHA
ncbi:MAG: acyl-CoA thioesterase [Verrucomicrobia bacterium]|jgi:acyl-CoA thioesterase FadM|nr:acyl-CoA thioesterase [Verrucomicrobiota bacterium]